jgi:hypothetical protein
MVFQTNFIKALQMKTHLYIFFESKFSVKLNSSNFYFLFLLFFKKSLSIRTNLPLSNDLHPNSYAVLKLPKVDIKNFTVTKFHIVSLIGK